MVKITREGNAATASVKRRGGTSPTNGHSAAGAAGMGTGVRLTGPRKLILDCIAGMGGIIEDKDGGATAILHERLQEAGHVITAKSLANALKAMEDRGLIHREVRGKRTYSIQGGGGVGQADLSGGADGHRPATRSEDADRAIIDLGISTEPSQLDLLAGSLLERVATILAREAEGGDTTSAVEVKRRLAGAIDEAQRAARKVRELEIKYDSCRDELAVTKQQVRVFKARSEQAEANIQSVIKAGGKPLDDRKLAALERFIKQTPSAKR